MKVKTLIAILSLLKNQEDEVLFREPYDDGILIDIKSPDYHTITNQDVSDNPELTFMKGEQIVIL